MSNEHLTEGNYWVKHNGKWIVAYYKGSGFFYPEDIGLAPMFKIVNEFEEIGERIDKKIENGFYWAKDENNQWKIVSLDNHLLNWFGRPEHSSINIHDSTLTLGPKIEYQPEIKRKSGYYWVVLHCSNDWRLIYYEKSNYGRISVHSSRSTQDRTVEEVLLWGDFIERPEKITNNQVENGLYWGRPINSPNTWCPTLVENNQATLLGYPPWPLKAVILNHKIEPQEG